MTLDFMDFMTTAVAVHAFDLWGFDIRLFVWVYANNIWILFSSINYSWWFFYNTIVHIFRSLTRESFFTSRKKN